MSDRKISEFFTPRSIKRSRPSSSPELVSVNNPERRVKIVEMENVAVGTLTMGKLLEELNASLSDLLDKKLANLATKSDLLSLSNDVVKLSQDCSVMKQDMDSVKLHQQRLLARINDLESRSRRNNIVIKGLNCNSKTDCRELVRKFCVEVLGSSDQVWVNRAHPLGSDGKTVIAHLPQDSDIEYLMSRTKTLKGTGYSVYRDYTWEVRQKRAHLMAVREEIEKVCGRRRMPIVHDRLIVENCRFTWEEGGLKAGMVDGAKKLQEILGRDFTAFLSNLVRNGPTRKHQRTDERTTEGVSQQATTTYSSAAAATKVTQHQGAVQHPAATV